MQSHKMNSRVVQFPQPTRPIGSYNISSPQNIHDSQSLQMPQPSEPITTYNISNEDHIAMPQYFDHSQVPVAPPSTTAEEKNQHEEKIQEAVEELCRGILEIYDRLPVSLQSQLNLDDIKAPTSFAKGLKTNSGEMRGCQQGSMEELRHKLERFKVKTIQLAEIVKEEQKR